jgi:hypothetical protein
MLAALAATRSQAMTTRTTSKIVTFARPFTLKGVDRILPPGEYRVVTDEELIEELSFPVSTPEQKCIGWPEQKYISEAGKKARRTGGPWFRHQAWIGLSAGVSELAGRARRLL